MRKILLLAVLAPLAACELQPGPPRPTAQSAPTPAPTPPAPTPTPTPTEAPANAAPTNAKVPVVITPMCLDAAEHIASVIIASATPAQRSIFETERDRIVRSSGEVCTVQAWSEAAVRCYKTATTQEGLKQCETKFPTQPARPVQPPPSDAQPVTNGGMRVEPGTPAAPGAGSAAPRPGAGTNSAAPVRPTPRPGAGTGSAAPVRPTPRPGAGSGSAAPVRPTPPPPAGGGLMPPRSGSGSGAR